MVDPALVREKLRDLHWFVSRLTIVDDQGRWSTLGELYDEQALFLDAFLTGKHIYVLKCRQIGMTTIAVAALFWKLYTSPDPRKLLQIAHEFRACLRMNQMIRTFHEGMPPQFRSGLYPDNQQSLGFTWNRSEMHQLMAAGRGQGRSGTYTDLHATEAGLWPRGSAAARSGTRSDKDVWASARATIHAPDAHVVVESTADGPYGVFYDPLYKTARTDPRWEMLFFPWYTCKRYATPFPSTEARMRFLETMTTEEEHILKTYALTPEQVLWRRNKLSETDLLRFRREYPMSQLEPFMLAAGLWFDHERLQEYEVLVPRQFKLDTKQELRIFQRPRQDAKYFCGMDTSGGTGNDYAVIQVLDQGMQQCAVWRSNVKSPKEQAIELRSLSALYNNALCLVEANRFGEDVLEEAQRLGCRLWRNDDGKWFYSSGRTAGGSKRRLYDWARHLINNSMVRFNDPITIHEASLIVEKNNGNIEADADDDHDDTIDAWVFAAWAARRYYVGGGTFDPAKERHRARMARARDPYGVKER